MKIAVFIIIGVAILGASTFFLREVNKADIKNAPLLTSSKIVFEYYGWFSVDYNNVTPALERLRTYTNTGFVYIPDQVSVLKELNFEHIIYVYNIEETVVELVNNENAKVSNFVILHEGKEYDSGIANYEAGITGFREKFFDLYRTNLVELKNALEKEGVLGSIDIFYLADEPALHRNIYLDQEFLDQIPVEFKKVFPDKQSVMVFAQNPDPIKEPFPGTGLHLIPPPALDIISIDPYIIPEEVSCEKNSVRNWLYDKNPYTNISWAKQYGKPIIVVGDAQLRDGKPIDLCYHRATYEILKSDTDISGLIWFAYDESYEEGGLSGAANNSEFVHELERLGI